MGEKAILFLSIHISIHGRMSKNKKSFKSNLIFHKKILLTNVNPFYYVSPHRHVTKFKLIINTTRKFCYVAAGYAFVAKCDKGEGVQNCKKSRDVICERYFHVWVSLYLNVLSSLWSLNKNNSFLSDLNQIFRDDWQKYIRNVCFWEIPAGIL